MITKKLLIEINETIVQEWQEMINVLSNVASVPVALIMRLDMPFIEVFIASQGEWNPYHRGEKEEIEGSGLYCETVINSRDKLLVPDALNDPEWNNNPDIKLGMISYLGFPILLPDGQPFGTICILDNKANAYSKDIEKLMLIFKKLVESNLELIVANQALGDENKRLSDYLEELQVFRGIVPICSNCKSIRIGDNEWSPIEKYLIGHPKADFSHGLCPKCARLLYPEIYPQ